MLGHLNALGSKPPPTCVVKRERSQSLDSAMTEQVLGALDASAVEAAEMLFSLKSGKRQRSMSLSSPGASRQQEEDETPLQPEERSSSSSGSACSESRVPCKTLTATSTPKLVAQLATRSYVWRGPKRSLLNQGLASSCPGQAALSSDPDEDEECGGGAGNASGVGMAVAPGSNLPTGSAERADRDKEWAALTTWLRMNLHHPRTAKREVLFLGKHVEGRGWHFFLNPALTWSDVSPETKMRLRTLPQETELAFMRKYPGKHGRDWVKKAQKYRPPGCSVTYSVPLADMIYSLTAIYYRYEGRPGTGASSASRPAVPASAASADHLDDPRVALNPQLSLLS